MTMQTSRTTIDCYNPSDSWDPRIHRCPGERGWRWDRNWVGGGVSGWGSGAVKYTHANVSMSVWGKFDMSVIACVLKVSCSESFHCQLGSWLWLIFYSRQMESTGRSVCVGVCPYDSSIIDIITHPDRHRNTCTWAASFASQPTCLRIRHTWNRLMQRNEHTVPLRTHTLMWWLWICDALLQFGEFINCTSA